MGKTDYYTLIMFLVFNISVILIYQIYSPTLNIGELAYFGIALFPLSVFLIYNPGSSVRLWLLHYVSISLILIYSAILFHVLVWGDFEWYYKLLSALMLIPAPIHLVKVFVDFIRYLKGQKK